MLNAKTLKEKNKSGGGGGCIGLDKKISGFFSEFLDLERIFKNMKIFRNCEIFYGNILSF